MEFLQKWLEQIDALGAGAAGAIAALRWGLDKYTVISVLAFIFTGAACAHYLTSIVVYYLKIDSAQAGGVGFLLGLFGGSFISAVIKAIQTADIWSLIKARVGGGSAE